MIYIWKYQDTEIVIVIQEKPHKVLKESVDVFLAILAPIFYRYLSTHKHFKILKVREKKPKRVLTDKKTNKIGFNRQKDQQKDCLIL